MVYIPAIGSIKDLDHRAYVKHDILRYEYANALPKENRYLTNKVHYVD